MNSIPPTSQEDRRNKKNSDAHFNAQFDARPIAVGIGGVGFSDDSGDMLVATVGSGILLSIYDQQMKMGAMAYVVLPDDVLKHFPYTDRVEPALVAKSFGPLDQCLKEMKERGAGKNRIKVRLFGGYCHEDAHDDNGLKNAVFVQEYLLRKGVQVSNADTGGAYVRRVHFFPSTGRAVSLLLKRDADIAQIEAAEAAYNAAF